MKRLIVNADDFGLHKSVNEAVEIAHREGVLTSASLTVNGESFEDAVDIAKRNERLGVGIHLTLNGERPVASAEEIFSIVDKDKRLFENHKKFCIDVLKGKVSLNHITVECEAQIEKFLQAGLTPTHIDSHRHVHLLPPILSVLYPILKRHNIDKIRWLNIPWFDYRNLNIGKVAFIFFVRHAGILTKRHYKHPDYFAGFFRSGSMDADYFKYVLDRLKPGVTEINFHPGKDNTLIGKKYGFWQRHHNWGCNWEKEFSALLDLDVRKTIDSNGISLINYAQMLND